MEFNMKLDKKKIEITWQKDGHAYSIGGITERACMANFNTYIYQGARFTDEERQALKKEAAELLGIDL